MRAFAYDRPATPRRGGRAARPSTVAGARLLAGGTDLIIRLRDGTVRPRSSST